MSDSLWDGIPNIWKQEMWDKVLEGQRHDCAAAKHREEEAKFLAQAAAEQLRCARAERALAELRLQKEGGIVP